MPRVGFEPTIPAFERAKTVHALDLAATVIGWSLISVLIMPKVSYSLMEIDMSVAFIYRDCGNNKKTGSALMFKSSII
jgi:hypothetical protein